MWPFRKKKDKEKKTVTTLGLGTYVPPKTKLSAYPSTSHQILVSGGVRPHSVYMVADEERVHVEHIHRHIEPEERFDYSLPVWSPSTPVESVPDTFAGFSGGDSGGGGASDSWTSTDSSSACSSDYGSSSSYDSSSSNSCDSGFSSSSDW